MATTDTATLISLFHTQEQAHAALADLRDATVPMASIQTLGGADAGSQGSSSTGDINSLQQLELPSSDLKMLSDGLRAGGTVIVVSTTGAYSREVEAIFKKHNAHQVDEQVTNDGVVEGVGTGLAAASTVHNSSAGDVVIPVVEEQLVVGKRAVQGGGVRVYTRMTETPVQEQVSLHEEHAVIERRPVNRAVTDADTHAFQEQSFEVTEMAEEAVVSKRARVVEEVVVGKDATDRTERVTDKVRKTEIEVEKVAADKLKTPKVNR